MISCKYKIDFFGIFNKLLVPVLIVCLVLGLTVTVHPAGDKTVRIYVDIASPDGGNGTADKPHNCLTSALEELNYNLAFGNYAGNVEVVFSGGVYSFGSTVRMTSAHSGRNNVRITYKAAEGEDVVFSGVSDGKVLSGSLIEISGASYITFDGICFEDNLNAPLLSVKGNNISVINCTFSGTGATQVVSSPEKGYALFLSGTQNTVEGCEIKGAEGGVYMKGGNISGLTDSGNAVRTNYIHHLTGCAVYVGGVSADVQNNTVTDTKNGVEFSGALHSIKYNRMSNISESAIHTAGSSVTAGIDVGYNFIDLPPHHPHSL